MDSKKTISKKEIVLYIIVPLATAIIGILGSNVHQDNREASLVKSMASRYERIETNMDLEQALEIAFEEKKNLEQNISSISAEKQKLQKQIAEASFAKVYDPMLVVDGLKKENAVGKGVVELDENIYFSVDMFADVWDKKAMFDKSKNTVYIGKNSDAMVENKTDLISQNIIYDGKYLEIYQPSDSKNFSMGSDTYNKGFTVGSDNYSLFGEGNGYALVDLKGKYSKLSFTVGRVNRNDLGIEDATLKVYLNGEYKKEYSLSGQKPSTQITVDLNHANELKLEVCGSKIVYGFADCILEK